MIESVLVSKCSNFPVYVLRASVADEVDWNAMASKQFFASSKLSSRNSRISG